MRLLNEKTKDEDLTYSNDPYGYNDSINDIRNELESRQNEENELILALIREVGPEKNADGSSTEGLSEEEHVAGFRSNHPAEAIRKAANGDVSALILLRISCGLSVLS